MSFQSEVDALLSSLPAEDADDMWALVHGVRRAFDAWRLDRTACVRFRWDAYSTVRLRVADGAIGTDGRCLLTHPSLELRKGGGALVLVTGQRIPRHWLHYNVRGMLERMLGDAGVPFARVWRPHGWRWAYEADELWYAARCRIQLEQVRSAPEGEAIVDEMLTSVVQQMPGKVAMSLAGHPVEVAARGVMVDDEALLAWEPKDRRLLISARRYGHAFLRVLTQRFQERATVRGLAWAPVMPPRFTFDCPFQAMRAVWRDTRPQVV